VSSVSQHKSPISRKWPVITLCTTVATHHKIGIQLTDKRRFAKYFHNSNSSLIEKKQQTQMALYSKLSCQFL